MSHICQALILSCIDFRFVSAIHRFAEAEGLEGNYDYAALAGGSMDILEKSGQSIIINQIDIASRLHQIKKIYLIHHEDCGAYGGKKSFSSDEEELTKHKTDLQKTTAVIKNKFPDLEIINVFAHLKEEGGQNVIWFEKL
ncbi:MAG TPA: carbonic anhydrase [Patescibacteria group bacterium]